MSENITFHHIGVATPNILYTASEYEMLGYEKTDIYIDEAQNVQVCFLTKEGSPTIELLAPVNEKSPVNKIIEKNGVIPYHLCFYSDDIEKSIADLREKGYIPIGKLLKSQWDKLNGKESKVVFLFNRRIGLIELITFNP